MKDLPPVRARLVAVLVGNGLLRLANLGGGALVSFYLAMLLRDDPRYHAGLLAALTAVSSGAELMGAIPFGMLADRFSPQSLLVSSAILGAAATQLFGISSLHHYLFCLTGTGGVVRGRRHPGNSGPPV